MKYKFGLIKSEGCFNTPSTEIYYKNYFNGYKPVQSHEIFGLINSTDGNFWILSEDDDHYWTVVKLSEETIRYIYNTLKNDDFSDVNLFNFKDDLLSITLNNLQDGRDVIIQFHKSWIPSLIKVLDIDNHISTNEEILPVWEKSVVPDKIIYPFMSPEELIYTRINEYPSLYANKDLELCKFKVFDQLFNTLGNGCSSFEDFESQLFKIKEIDIVKAKRFCTEPHFDGYSEVDIMKLETKELVFPKSGSCVVYSIFEEEKENYPNVIYWQKNNPNEKIRDLIEERKEVVIKSKFRPYPNFEKEYSILWNTPEIFNILNKEWLLELIWFYENCTISINDGCYKDNGEFPTGSVKEDEKRINEMIKFIKDKTNEVISKDYGVEYNGDIEEFLTKRWDKRKKEYFEFIDETVELLKSKL